MKDKILVFESRSLCYNSSDCFLRIMCKEFKRLGIEVEYVRLESIEEDEEILLSYIGKSYLAVLDINSDLTLAFSDDQNDYYLNLIHAPFYHFILDHPIHLHEKLSVPLKDYHVICLDCYHAEYIKNRYFHIKDVTVMYFGGISAGRDGWGSMIPREEFCQKFKERSWDILFPATYIPEDYYMNLIRKKDKRYVSVAGNMLDLMSTQENITIEDAFQKVVKETKNIDSGTRTQETDVYEICRIDHYIRAWLRNRAISELLKNGRNIHVFGGNWTLYKESSHKNLRIHEPVPYQLIPDFMLQAKVLLNTQPLFQDGPHDRIMNGIMNGMAVLTDSCGYLRRNFMDGTDIKFYKRNQLSALPSVAEQLFQDENVLLEIAWNGYKKAIKDHTWKVRVEQLLEHIKEKNEKR